MAKSENQKSKILYVMKILMEQTDEEHGLTMQELIEALDEVGIAAERKSLYRDIEVLQEYGMDIDKRKEGAAVYYFVGSRLFELPELKLLVDAVQSSKFITYKKSEQLIKKVESLASHHEAQQLQREVYVHNRIKTMNESIYYNVDTLQTALAQKKQISFLYFEWQVDVAGKDRIKKQYRHGGARYQVSPWGLTWDDENYYLVAYDEKQGGIRHYRVDKMADIKIENAPRMGQEQFRQFDMALYARRVFSMYGGTPETVTLRFANGLIGVVIDRFGTDIHLRPETDGHFVASVHVIVSPQFLAWVFGLGNEVEILSPDSVKQAFLDKIDEIKKQY